MRSAGLIVLAALVLLAPTTADARGSGMVVGCGERIGADFSDAFADRQLNLVAGPLALVRGKARESYSQATIDKIGGDKFPVVLRNGRTAVVRIAMAFRRAPAGWERVPKRDVHFGNDGPTRARFVACPRDARLGFNPTVANTTPWMLGFSVTEQVCVYLDISVDGGPSRRRALPFGAGPCPTRNPLR